MACILLWSPVVRVHDSQEYKKMDVTREYISRILKLREIPLSFQTCFILVNDAFSCAILESISGLEPSSVITEPRYLKLVTVSSFCPFTLISVEAAVQSLKKGTSAVVDNIPAELVQAGGEDQSPLS